MNPIKHFEIALERAWKAELKAPERAKQLRNVGQAIDHYLARIESAPTEASEGGSNWRQLKIERAKEYLAHLSRDSRQLAAKCMDKSADALKARA